MTAKVILQKKRVSVETIVGYLALKSKSASDAKQGPESLKNRCLRLLSDMAEQNTIDQTSALLEQPLTRVLAWQPVEKIDVQYAALLDACSKDSEGMDQALLKGCLSKICHLDLSIYQSPISEMDWTRIAAMPALRSLNVSSRSDVSDEMITQITALCGLTRLTLAGAYSAPDGEMVSMIALPELSSLTQLQNLDLSFCVGVNDEVLASLGTLTQMQYLTLKSCMDITDMGIASLKNMGSLVMLNVSYCFLLTDAATMTIRELTSLRSVDISGCQNITDVGLNHIASSPCIERLSICNNQNVTLQGAQSLSQMSSLTHLELGYSPSDFMKHVLTIIPRLGNLVSLGIDGCVGIEEGDLDQLLLCERLEVLSLREGDSVTDNLLVKLASLPCLKRIDVSRCNAISKAGVDALRQKGIEVIWETFDWG